MSILDDLSAIGDCVSHPLRCASASFDTWFQALPGEWLLLGGLVAGMLLGAALGWRGVLAVLSLGALLAYLNRRPDDDYPHEGVRPGSKDAAPPIRRKTLLGGRK